MRQFSAKLSFFLCRENRYRLAKTDFYILERKDGTKDCVKQIFHFLATWWRYFSGEMLNHDFLENQTEKF